MGTDVARSGVDRPPRSPAEPERWDLLGRRRGGSVAALLCTPPPDAAIYAATPVGVFRANAGWSWDLLRPSPPAASAEPGPVSSENGFPLLTETLACSPRGSIFAGTPTGLYRWTDARRAWEIVLAGDRIVAVVHAGEAESPILLAGGAADGVFVSVDDGDAWRPASPGLEEPTVVGLAASPGFTIDHIAFVATTAGLYRTRSREIVWRRLDLLGDEAGIECLAVSPRFPRDGTVYLGTADGLLRSRDRGDQWEAISNFTGRATTAIAVDPGSEPSERIAVATTDGVFLSDDGGRAWTGPIPAPDPVISLGFGQADGRDVLLVGCTGSGVWCHALTNPAGRLWHPCSESLTGVLHTGLVALPAGQEQDTVVTTTIEEGVRRSHDGGQTWRPVAGVNDEPVFALAHAPGGRTATRLYAARADGVRWSEDGGERWLTFPVPAAQGSLRSLAVGEAAGGHDAMLLAAADGRWWLTEDGGQDWRQGRLDAGRSLVAACLAPDYARMPLALVTTVAQPGDPAAPAVRLWVSTDGGRSWRPWLALDGAESAVPLLPPDVALHRTLLAGVGPTLFRTRVSGGEERLRWDGLTLPRNERITAMAALPAYPRDRQVLVATDAFVWLFDERTGEFQPWGDGLVGLPILALAATPPTERRPASAYAVDLVGGIWRRRLLVNGA